jgi:hypothetical protein
MTHADFLTRIIDDGIAAATADYKEGPKLRGAIKGFEACRGKTAKELVTVWSEASGKLRHYMGANQLDDYWFWNCYQLEVEWVLNCLSAASGESLLGHLPTTRGYLKAAEVLGVLGRNEPPRAWHS